MKKQKAFGLIEIIVVMAVVGLLATFGWPEYQEQSLSNKRTDAIIATNAVAIALTQYQSDNGIFAWDAAPGGVTDDNAHNRYLPLVNVGNNASNAAQNNTCTQDRGYRYSTTNARYESCRGYYVIEVTLSNSDTSFSISTTPVVGSSQAQDTRCPAFTINELGQKGVGAGSSVKHCWRSS